MEKILFTFDTNKNPDAIYTFDLGKNVFNLFNSAYPLYEFNLDNGDKVLLIGELFYIEKNSVLLKMTDIDIEKDLHNILNLNVLDDYDIKNMFEGHYIITRFSKQSKKVTIFGDFFNRVNIFYTVNNNNVVGSTILTNHLLKVAGSEINMSALGNIISQNYCLDEDTLYTNIKRLGFNQMMLFTSSGVKIEKKNFFPKINDYTDNDLNTYENILINSIESRKSNTTNIVSCSGGWDSTLLLDLLASSTSQKDTYAACFELSLGDGRIFNQYEIEKVKEIAKNYNVKLCLHTIDPSSNDFLDSYLKYMENIRQNHLFVLSHHYYRFVETLKSTFGDDVTFFNGEGCDSLHNFGFSQYISISYSDRNFAEYADKMKCFLYSPTFFDKIRKNIYDDDVIYKIFKWHYGLQQSQISYDNFSDRIFHFLYAFLFSSHRIPLIGNSCSDYFDENEFEKYLSMIKSSLQDEVQNINESNIYSILSRLYCRYWLKGSNIMRVYCSIRDLGLRPALPFIDLKLFKFLETMPESWGRGLEMNTVKYPLKRLIEKRPNFPYHIISRTPHSYLTEVYPDTPHLYHVYMCNSKLSDYYKSILSDKSKTAFLELPMFNQTYIKNMIASFLANQLPEKDVSLFHNIMQIAAFLDV